MERVTRPLSRLLGLLCLLLPTLLPGAEHARIGQGDPRVGYDSSDYTTDSRQITELSGRAADLVALVDRPPLGLPPLALARPITADSVSLGRRLFFDRRLSFNGTLSCAMCHIPEQGFTQHELTTPAGIEGRVVKRNASALYNVAYRKILFFDGREDTLEQQVWSPLLAVNEMGNPSIGVVLRRLNETTDYEATFIDVFGTGINVLTLGMALADYQRGLISADSPFDRWYFSGMSDAVGDSAKRGFELFVDKDCSACHQLENGFAHFTDDDFHDTGLGFDVAMKGPQQTTRMQIAPGVIIDIESDALPPNPNDLGRYEITGKPEDRWKFRTPSLRNVAITAPYMHDGSLARLRDVLDFYNAGGVPHDEQDERVRPLGLTEQQIEDIIAFLETLTGSNVDALAADARLAPIGDVD